VYAFPHSVYKDHADGVARLLEGMFGVFSEQVRRRVAPSLMIL
jgi:hypothetical protein